jgi:ATP-binding cassette, subfamily B, bacterial
MDINMKDSIFNQIRYLYGYIGEHKKILIFSLCLSIISTALGMIQPIFAKIMIDKVLIANNRNLLIPILSLIVSLLIIGFIIRIVNSYIYTRYSAKFLFKMREEMFSHLHKIPLSFFSKTKIGDIYHRISSDMAEIQGFITTSLPNYLFDFLTCIITVIILFWLNLQMALMSLIFIPGAFYIVFKIRPKLLILGKKTAEKNADLSHFIFESLSSTSLIRSFGAEKFEQKKIKKKHSRILKYILQYQVIGAMTGSIPIIFIIINTIIVFGYGGILVMNGDLTIGSLVAFSIYQGRVFTPLQGIVNGFLSIQNTKVSLARVKEILNVEPQQNQKPDFMLKKDMLRGEIAFKNVSFSYEKKEPVLDNVSFFIPSGKVTAIIGPSGSGKTTICHLIMRLFTPDSGKITIDNIDLKRIGINYLRKQIAIVSQDTFLFHTSIIENIRFSKHDASDEEIIQAAKAACIHDFIASLPNGYDTIVGDRGIRLSGGQKQRVSIARSILIEPKILILDEATAFIDTTVEERLKKTIRSLMENRTIIVVSHRPESIEHADKIIVCEKGKVYER